MSIIKVKETLKEKSYSVLGIKFKRPTPNYKHELKFIKKLNSSELLPHGLSLRANFSENSGESQVAKDFRNFLDAKGIAYDAHEFHKLSAYPKYKKLINFTTQDYIKHKKYHNFTVLFWEFESGMLEARPYIFTDTDTIIVFSDFCYNYVNSIIPQGINLIKLIYPFNFNIIPTKSVFETRAAYGISPNDFVVYFNFSYFSSYFRKNPEAVLEVFQKSLSNKKNCKLFIKTNGSTERSRFHRIFTEKIKELKLSDNIILENNKLNREDLINTLNMCNVYTSLHRGEGLGLGMLEAMSLGKPVIGTNYGGNTDFVKDHVAFPINYKLIRPLQTDIKEYRNVKEWAEPNKEQCIEILQKLYHSPSYAEEIGNKAKDFVLNTYQHERIFNNIKEKLLTD